MEPSKTVATLDAMSRSSKMTDPRQPVQHPEGGWRNDGGPAQGGDFDLKVTLQETEVREASYAEFLDLLKQSGRSGA
jgi:hypothetical protein